TRPRQRVTDVAFQPAGKLLATRHEDTPSVSLWQVTSGEEVRVLGHRNPILCLAFTPDGPELLPADTAGAFQMWDRDPGAQKAGWKADFPVRGVGLLPDGKNVAVLGIEGPATVKLQHRESATGKGQASRSFPVPGSRFGRMELGPAGHLTALCGHDGSLHLW